MLFLSKQKSSILLFHRVLPVRDKMWDPMDPALFDETLKYATQKFNTLSLNELLFDPPKSSSKPLAAITFDDGYKDFIDHSIPLLKRYNMPASMFIVTDCIENNLPTWTYVIDYLFENTKKLKLNDFDFPSLKKEFQKTNWINSEDRISYGKKFKQYLKWIPSSTRSFVINNLLHNFNDVESPKGMMMTWQNIKEIKDAGFDIGSHSVTHVTLATVEDDKELESELVNSKKIIKEKAGIEPLVFSYPCGSYDERVKTYTKNAGYKAGLAVNRQLYNPNKDDLFEVPRIELYNEGWIKTKMRVTGSMNFIDKILNR